MRPKTTATTIVTYGVLALAGAAPMVMPEHLTMPSASGASGTALVSARESQTQPVTLSGGHAAASKPDMSGSCD